jgi:hypothetical protein
MLLCLQGRSSTDVDALTAGFSLFLLIKGSPEATTQARDRRTVVYSLLHGKHVAPSLDQIREIVSGAPQQMALTLTLTSLDRCYQGYSTFISWMCSWGFTIERHSTASAVCRHLSGSQDGNGRAVDTFQGLKMETEEQFGSEIHAALPLFQRHTQLRMARYFNDATVIGAQAPVPQVMDLVDIIKYRRSTQLPPPLPLRYTHAIGPGGLARGTNSQPTGCSIPAPAPAPADDTEMSEHVQNAAPQNVLMTRFARTNNKHLRDLTAASSYGRAAR